MSENNFDAIPHFSKKILFFSVIFVLVNAAWFALTFSARINSPALKPLAPKLSFTLSQDVQVKSVFDTEWVMAKSGQELYRGGRVKTGDQSFAEISFDGSAIKLDQNTEIELAGSFYDFSVISGVVWVSSVDTVTLKTPFVHIILDQSAARYQYDKHVHKLDILSGGADLVLLDTNGDKLSDFFVPLGKSASFFDSQISPVYAKLELSKLKKELRITNIAPDLLDEKWARRGSGHIKPVAENASGFFQLLHLFQDKLDTLKVWVSFFPGSRHRMQIQRIRHQLAYLESDPDAFKPEQFEIMAKPLYGDPELSALFGMEWKRISLIPYNSPGFALKQMLRSYLAKESGASFFRTYLVDMEQSIRRNESDTLKPQIGLWLKQWDADLLASQYDEFERQCSMLFGLFSAYPDFLTPDILAVFESAEKFRLAAANNRTESLLTILDEQLDLVTALADNGNTALAKQYLKSTYDQFTKEQISALPSSASELFLHRAELAAGRIDFFEKATHGAAGHADEAAFQAFLEQRSRDKALSSTLQSFLDEKPETDGLSVSAPLPQDVVQRFSEARILINKEDIASAPDSPFEFNVQNARLLDRAPDGSLLVFSAHYDYQTNGVEGIKLGSKPFRGNFELKDLVALLTEVPAIKPKPETPLFQDLLSDEKEETKLRAQRMAQDLALQLAMESIERNGITLSRPDQISIIDSSDTNRFQIKEADIANVQVFGREVQASFEFNLSTKTVSRVSVTGRTLNLPAQVPIANFTKTLQEALYSAE